jgi:hypothetical protein
MRAMYSGSGICINLNKSDKEKGLEKRILECKISDGNKEEFILKIVNKIPPDKNRFLEEPSFHIDSYPPRAGPGKRIRYNAYLTKEKFEELVNPKDPIRGGYCGSRTRFDRIEFTYFEC